MTSTASSPAYIGFPATPEFLGKINRFLEAAEARDPSAGNHYVEVVEALTDIAVNSLLLEIMEIAKINPTGQKVMKFCASTCTSISSKLSAKIYKNNSPQEMLKVAEIWQTFLKNSGDKHSGDWYILTPISPDFAQRIDSILQERDASGNAYTPPDRDYFISQYDQLIDIIIEEFFLKATGEVSMGWATKKMLDLGLESVRKAIHAVLHKVVKNLEPEPMARYVDHTKQFYVRLHAEQPTEALPKDDPMVNG